jgi:hypothetical protein
MFVYLSRINATKDEVSKSIATYWVACIIVCILLSGCQLFTKPKKRLNRYCPRLIVDIDAVNWSGNGPTKVITVDYDRSFVKRVDAYFAETSVHAKSL